MEILGWLALLVPLLWFTVFSLFCLINPFGGVQDKIENVISWILPVLAIFFWYKWIMYPWSL